MGLFGKKQVVCGICGQEGIRKAHQAKDGAICDDCYASAGFPAAIPISIIPLSVLSAQINSDDGKSIIGRFKESGGVMPDVKPIQTTSCASAIKCPKCGCVQISADKKGFGVGKAVVGAAIAGPIGLVGGNIGANKVRVTCLKCGHQWEAGKA